MIVRYAVETIFGFFIGEMVDSFATVLDDVFAEISGTSLMMGVWVLVLTVDAVVGVAEPFTGGGERTEGDV